MKCDKCGEKIIFRLPHVYDGAGFPLPKSGLGAPVKKIDPDLRDRIAIAAMQTLIDTRRGLSSDGLAKESYNIADTMLEMRGRK